MSGLLGMIGQRLDPGTVDQISSQLGTDHATTEKAIAAALPSLLGGMAQHASTDQGAADIHQAVQSAPADGAVPTATPSASGGLLSKILGPHESTATQHVAQASGINTQQAAKVLLTIAPLAVAVLARRHAQNPAATQQPGGLSSILSQAASSAQSATSGGTAGLGGLLGHFFG